VACAVLAIAIAAGPVSAERAGPRGALVTAPATWRSDPEQATALAQRFAATGHLGGLEVVIAAEAYVADTPGVVLFATRATASISDPAQAARAARAALDELRAVPRRASLSGGTARDEAWQERVEDAPPQVVATLTWRDPASKAVAAARVVVASDGARVAAVTGECLASESAAPAAVSACRTALATLDPGIDPAHRIATAPAAVSADSGAPVRPLPPARLDVAPRVVFPPTTIDLDPGQPLRETDRRPVYVGAGLVALALVFWWNRRQRDRFDREDHPAQAPRDLRTAAAAPHDDEDADDLHAAARGERRLDDREDDRQPP
jgi:hypothetical protein